MVVRFMRIIAGTAKGRRLKAPAGKGTRPMTDKAKEALFSSLGGAVVGARVLDLFAGSGALGLEALSRGAASAVFVEKGRAALGALRDNVEAAGLGGEIMPVDASSYRPPGEVDLVFVDPPYALPLGSVEKIVARLGPHLAGDGIVIVHRRAGEPEPAPEGFRLTDRRRYGDVMLSRLEKEEA
jgi:16S rRNA (guanine966-N2)-methyltransferase